MASPTSVLITDIASGQTQADADAFYGGPVDFSTMPTTQAPATAAAPASTGVSPWLWIVMIGAGLLLLDSMGKK
jgi:hypothetical protein